jgi:hypothetical protein
VNPRSCSIGIGRDGDTARPHNCTTSSPARSPMFLTTTDTLAGASFTSCETFSSRLIRLTRSAARWLAGRSGFKYGGVACRARS